MANSDVNDILKKYGSRIETEIKSYNGFSRDYESFRKEMTPQFSGYEKWCKALGNFFKIKVAEKDRKIIDSSIATAHLNLSASEVVVFSVSVLFFSLFLGILLSLSVYFFSGAFSLLVMLLIVFASLFLFYYSYKTPERLAQQWRLKASSQMVPAILYVVIYMKHTSNLEKAIAFASEHLQNPLAMDFKKIFWDVQVGKFSSVKESLENYLENWRGYSLEFIEAFHLIESSLYEPSEQRRVETLEKSLQVILDGVYDKMLKYVHDVRSPLTNIYMLGIILPTLSLAILPLASTMLQGAIKWYHILLIFNILVPFLVIYLTSNVMMKRPGGYGESSLLEQNPLYSRYKSNKPYFAGAIYSLPFIILGIIPFLWRYTNISDLLGMKIDYSWNEIGLSFMGNSGIFGIMPAPDGLGLVGPFGALSLILSLFFPLGIALMFSTALKIKSQELIKSRDQYKELEQEFTSALFQLGNRMGDGTPAETAFLKVSESTKGTASEGFFKIVNENINQLGMSLREALFNPKRGALIFYPSELVVTSMEILIESVKKGLKVAARALMSISDYVKNIKKINDRMNDLLAELISDMKSNMTFLAPLLSGIIVGLSGMITLILANLSALFSSGDFNSEVIGQGGLAKTLQIFDITTMIPTYWLQIVIGLYLVEIVFILSSSLVTIKSGRDPLEEAHETAGNLKTSVILYFVVAMISVVALSLLAAIALRGLT